MKLKKKANTGTGTLGCKGKYICGSARVFCVTLSSAPCQYFQLIELHKSKGEPTYIRVAYTLLIFLKNKRIHYLFCLYLEMSIMLHRNYLETGCTFSNLPATGTLVKWFGYQLGPWETCVQFLPLAQPSCMTLDKSLNLCHVPQFPL